LIISIVFFWFSYQVKFASVVLIPVLAGLWLDVFWQAKGTFKRCLEFLKMYWPELSAGLLFLPLFTDRSQQFNPWYLIWSLAFLPFIKVRWVRLTLIVFSLTSLLRYVPFLYLATYSPTEQLESRIITWSAVVLSSMVIWLSGLGRKAKKQRHA
jgi:hypothetical protein